MNVMAYQANLNGTQQITIFNQGVQTQVTSSLSSPGQQQSQSSSFSTGKWQKKPQLFQTNQGYILQVDGVEKPLWLVIQTQGIQVLETMPNIQNAIPIELTSIAEASSQSTADFQPMQPMQPMKMGNMSMDINSMSMQMGNMSLNLENQAKQATKVFCSQCGREAKSGDRFCRSCGHELSK